MMARNSSGGDTELTLLYIAVFALGVILVGVLLVR
jgi:hypothetical protein